jgi:hypothetical protein
VELDIDDVQSLRITSGPPTQLGLRSITIVNVREEPEWRFTAPDPGFSSQVSCLASADGCVADPYIIHLAIDDLCHLAAQRILLEETDDVGQYGLAPAALVLEMTTVTGDREELYIGRQTPDGMSYYLQHAGDDRLYLVAQHTLQPFFEWLKEPPYQPTPAVDQD